MSISYIELSSDDEVQIIGEIPKLKKGTNGSSSARSASRKAFDKLSRNSNIQLSINVENVDCENDESSKPLCVTKKNGFIRHYESPLEKARKKEKALISIGYKSNSSHVEIIDEKTSKCSTQLQEQNTLSTLEPPIQSSIYSMFKKVYDNGLKNNRTKSQALNSSSNTLNDVKQDGPPSPGKVAPSSAAASPQMVPKTPLNGQNNINKVLKNSNGPVALNQQRRIAPTFILYSPKKESKTPLNGVRNIKRTSLDSNKLNDPLANSKKHVQSSQRKSVMPILEAPRPLTSKKLDSDVVYVIDDDDDDDDDDDNTNDETSLSAKSQNFKGNANASEIADESSYTEQTARPTQPKKRYNPDRAMSSASLNLQDLSVRVTRSSRSLSSSKKPDTPRKSTSKSKSKALAMMNEPMNKYSIENMFSGLVKICKTIFSDDSLETKLWRTFKQASEQVLRSEEFINALKVALKTSEESKINSLDDKLLISREVKEVMRIMKRHPEVVDKKVKRLTHMLNVIRSRIRRLEEAEVTSDEDEENSYVLLDRYRIRATKIHEKLCELQGISADAGRIVHQKIQFAGTSGYPKIEQALAKFYLKTKSFPDFFDVRTVVEKTVKKENLDIHPHKIHNIAQTVFLEFGTKLKRMRCCDDYTILNDYIEDNQAKDPAIENDDLHEALAAYDSSRRIREGEQKILDEYTCKQDVRKMKEGGKSEETEASDESEDEGALENKVEKRDLHFSDTDEELMTDAMPNRKRKKSISEDENEEKKEKKSAHESNSELVEDCVKVQNNSDS